MFKVIFTMAFLIRIIFVPLPGFKADIAYWKWWGMSAAHEGITGPLVNTAYNYPSFYLYILKATSHLYELFSGYNYALDKQSSIFWNDRNLLYLFLIKFPYILADLGIGFLIYKIVKGVLESFYSSTRRIGGEKSNRVVLSGEAGSNNKNIKIIALISASFYLFNPVVIYNSAIWGQTDSLGSLFILLAFYFLLARKFKPVGIFSALAVFMKTQTIIFLPLFFLIIFLSPQEKQEKNNRATDLIGSLWTFIATVIFINLPFLANHLMDRVFDIMYTSQLYFPYVSMNAYNLWWIFFGKNSPSYLDQNFLAGFVTFKTAGVLLFGFFYALAMAMLIRLHSVINLGRGTWNLELKTENLSANGKKLIANNYTKIILSSLILISFAFFMLLTQMHERYLFPLFVFFPILLGIEYMEKNKLRFYLLSIVYCLLSILILINLHQVMIMNYPDNTFPLLPNVFSENLTRVVAVLNLLVFLILAVVLTLSLSFIQKAGIFFLFLLFLIVSVLSKNLLASEKIVHLIKIKPSYTRQGFGSLAVNRNLSNNWLSSLYYYSLEGFATHANSEISFNLDKKYREFTSVYGIDNDANTSATVVFVVQGDGRELFRSTKIDRFSLPGYVKIKITGVGKLSLIVEDAGDGINSDHADWLDARLYK